MALQFDSTEFIVRLCKYLLEGIVVAVAAFFFADTGISWDSILLIGLTAACTFALIDSLAPALSASVRQGAGLGIGLKMTGVGGPGLIR